MFNRRRLGGGGGGGGEGGGGGGGGGTGESDASDDVLTHSNTAQTHVLYVRAASGRELTRLPCVSGLPSPCLAELFAFCTPPYKMLSPTHRRLLDYWYLTPSQPCG